jgi:predicted nucleic acid-binding protein
MQKVKLTLLVDTNVILDVLGSREPFVADSKRVWELCEAGSAEGWVSAITFNNVLYILRKLTTAAAARRHLRDLRRIFHVAAVDGPLVDAALTSPQADFENAVQYASAISIKATCLITRNVDDFPRRGAVPVRTPASFAVDV